MNTSKPRAHLLETIKAFRASVGDGLDESELTSLLRGTALLGEAGFGFLSFSDGCVTLSVPEQDPADWYESMGKITAQKQRIARQIAEKHELSLYEPVDSATNFRYPVADSTAIRHHLELTDRWQTVVVAHPHYLKVRLYGKLFDHRYPSEALCALPLGPELLRDLAALYSGTTDLHPDSLSR